VKRPADALSPRPEPAGSGIPDRFAVTGWRRRGCSAARIVNTGVIGGVAMATGDLAGRSFAIVEDTGVAGMTTQIHNSGTLAGEVYLGNLADSLRNSGEVLGAVDMGLDADVVFNSDLIVGNVDLGDGADRYKGLGGGLVDGIVRGGTRADTLTGGAGSDLLDGGEGPDTFLFTSVADSGLGPASDRIRDFDPGEDLIDLEAVAPGVLSFVGNAAFTGGGTSSVRFTFSAGGPANVLIDVDGDGIGDMRIIVQGVTTLTANDFLL
jgi:hypothetical protein